MGASRLLMRRINEILRLKYECHRTPKSGQAGTFQMRPPQAGR